MQPKETKVTPLFKTPSVTIVLTHEARLRQLEGMRRNGGHATAEDAVLRAIDVYDVLLQTANTSGLVVKDDAGRVVVKIP